MPQLRIGRSLLARSRRADDVVIALDHVLGGVLARQDDARRWLGLRTFVVGDRAVLVDATPPALTADPRLARAGVTELPTWSVAVDGDTVLVPPPLTAAVATRRPTEPRASRSRIGRARRARRVRPRRPRTRPATPGPPETASPTTWPSTIRPTPVRCSPGSPPVTRRTSGSTPSRGSSPMGVSTSTTDRAAAAEQIRRLLAADDPTG